MHFTAQLNSDGLGEAVEVFPILAGFECQGIPLAAAFNPAFTITSRGTMLAFAEGRLGSSHDDAPKTVLVNRSDNWGRTWEGMRALTMPGCHFGPRPYIIEKDGRERICVLVTFSCSHLKQQYSEETQWREVLGIGSEGPCPNAVSVVVRLISDDDGKTWQLDPLIGDRTPFSVPVTGELWIGFGDFTGTVETIPAGPYAGRRIVAVSAVGVERTSALLPDSMRKMENLGSSVLYSDDGENWALGGVIFDRRGNECAAVPIGRDHSIAMLRRPNAFRDCDLKRFDCIVAYRLLHHSTDGGQTWSAPIFPEGLPYLKQAGRRYDHQCLPSLCAWDNTLLTAMPSAADSEKGTTSRTHGVIGFSDDLGLTWRHKLIDAGEFSYATIGRVGNEGCIVMFSRGKNGEHGSFSRAFTMDWLRKSPTRI